MRSRARLTSITALRPAGRRTHRDFEAGHRLSFVVAVDSNLPVITVGGRERVKEAGLLTNSFDVELQWVINPLSIRSAQSARIEPVSPTDFSFIVQYVLVVEPVL